MPYIDIKISKMPEGLDEALRTKRDEIILEGKTEFKEILHDYDKVNAKEQDKMRRAINAKKGSYSRKFHQYSKELFLTQLFEQNNIAINFKNLDNISLKIFGSHIEYSVLGKMEKNTSYDQGDRSPIDIVDEKETTRQIKQIFENMVAPYRKDVLSNLSLDAVDKEYAPMEVKSKEDIWDNILGLRNGVTQKSSNNLKFG